MQITIAAIVDFASVSKGEKLNLLGVFDRITSQSFPFHHPHVVLAARFQFEYEDGNKKHHVSTVLQDEDGKKIVDGGGEIGIGKIPPGDSSSKNLIINLHNIQFDAPGNYVFVVSCGDARVRVPFKVVRSG